MLSSNNRGFNVEDILTSVITLEAITLELRFPPPIYVSFYLMQWGTISQNLMQLLDRYLRLRE